MDKKQEKILKNLGKVLLGNIEGIDQKEALKGVDSFLNDERNKKKKEKLNSEYQDLVDFSAKNNGYEDYILLVSELFNDDMKNEREIFFKVLKERYQNFDDYNVKFNDNYVQKSDNNPFINEMFSKKNVDILLMVAPNIEDRLLEKKTDSEKRLFLAVKKKDPVLALELLVSHKKNMNNTFKRELYDKVKVALDKKSVDLKNKSIAEFITDSQDVLSGIFMSKAIRPLGALPAKKIINTANDYVEEYNKNEVNISNSTINITINSDTVKPAKNINDFIDRVLKYKKSLFSAIALVSATFFPSTLVNSDQLSPIAQQDATKNQVVMEIAGAKYSNYQIKDGDTLYSIARGQLKGSGLESDNQSVSKMVDSIVQSNPWLENSKDDIKINAKIKIKTPKI